MSTYDDIAYLRGLAESGRNGPILGGAAQAAAGLVYGCACLAQWAVLSRFFPTDDMRQASHLIWLVSSSLVVVVTAVFYSGARRKIATQGGAIPPHSGWPGRLAAAALSLLSRAWALPPTSFTYRRLF